MFYHQIVLFSRVLINLLLIIVINLIALFFIVDTT